MTEHSKTLSSKGIFALKDLPILAIEPNTKTRSMDIVWALHGLCNNSCYYCDPHNYEGSHGWLSLEMVNGFVDRLMTHYGDIEHFNFFFTGGEPTMWKPFVDMCEYIQSKDVFTTIGLNTNGSRSVEYFDRMANSVDTIVLSYHSEYTRDERILSWIDKVGCKTQVAVRLMMPPKEHLWQRCLDFAEKLKQLKGPNHVHVDYVPLQDNFGKDSSPMKYSDEQVKFWRETEPLHFAVNNNVPKENITKKHYEYWQDAHYTDGSKERLSVPDMVGKGRVNFLNWTCYAGRELLFIAQEGQIFRAGCQAGGQIGHISDEKIEFPEDPVICPKSFCPCGSDIQVRKYSPEYFQKKAPHSPEVVC